MNTLYETIKKGDMELYKEVSKGYTDLMMDAEWTGTRKELTELAGKLTGVSLTIKVTKEAKTITCEIHTGRTSISDLVGRSEITTALKQYGGEKLRILGNVYRKEKEEKITKEKQVHKIPPPMYQPQEQINIGVL